MENKIVTINGVRGYESPNKTAYLNLEDVAKGLGFTKKDKKDDKEYIRWNKQIVKNWLVDFGILNSEDNLPEFIPENVFYKLCMKASNEVARKFQDLVCDEILPQIRKTGGYIPYNDEDTDEEILAKAVLISQKTIERKNARIKELENKIEEDKPKVLFADSVSASESTISIGDLSKLLNQNGIKIGRTRLFIWLRNNGYLIKQKGKSYNTPTQRAMDMKLFEVSEVVITGARGLSIVNITTKVTGKGQQYFINKFLKNEE